MVPKLHLHVLASGSKGNATVIEGPEESVLVDCGLSRRELHRRADAEGVDLGRVQALLLTHEHIDHTKGIEVVSKYFDGALVSTAGTVGARRSLVGLPWTLIDDDETFSVAGMVVCAFPTSHDVADPIGFRFSVVDEDGEEVLSGGRYDKLISEFGYDVPAIGFAVNINAVAKLMEKSDVLPAEPKADVIVYAEEGCEVAALKAAKELREQGLIVENALFDDLESVREYAMEKKIAKVVVIDGESKEVNI